jgi:hypothetical protein
LVREASLTADQKFGRLLNVMDELPAAVVWLHSDAPPEYDLTSYPDVTIFRLERAATLDFRGTLALLNDPRVSYTSESLIRGVLETDAQLFRINGYKRASWKSRQRRAICFEFGSVRSLYDSMLPRKDRTGRYRPTRRLFSTAESRRSIKERYQVLMGLHDQVADIPNCRGNDYQGVKRILEMLSKRERAYRWIVPYYEVSSMTAHQLLQRGLVNTASRPLAMVEPSLAERVSFLDRAFGSYQLCVQLCGLLHMPKLVQLVHDVVPRLQRAVSDFNASLEAGS